jgi:hypothetical protein
MRDVQLFSATPVGRAPAIALLLVALVLAACNQQRESPGDLLKLASFTYNEGLRWKRYTDSAAMLPADERDDFLRRMEDERDSLFFVDYEVRRVDLNADATKASVDVDYTWYRLPSTTLEHTRMRQKWTRLEDAWTLSEQERIERRGDADGRPHDSPPPAEPQ